MDAIDSSLLRLLSIDGLADQLTSRLNPEDYEALRCTSRGCRSSIPPRRPFLVVTDFVGNKDYEELSPGLYTDDANYLASTAFPSPLCRKVIEDFSVRKVVLNFAFASFRNLDDNVGDYVSSCGDLMCFYTARHGYIYSPTTNQYLPFHFHTNLSPTRVRVAIVYIASIRAFKAVMLEVLHHNWLPISKSSLRFTALAVLQQGGGADVDDHLGTTSSSSGELLCETDLAKFFGGVLGNLIGVNGALYAVIHFEDPLQGWKREAKMLSLDLEQKNNYKLKIFSLPPCCDDDDGKPPNLGRNITLSQVKDLLCYPHTTTTTSTVDLWMLHPDDGYTWSKGYTFHYDPRTPGYIGQLVYFPHHAAGDDDWAGLFLFEFKQQLFQYDLATKKAGCLLKSSFQKMLHIVASHSRCFSLRNGLRCPSLPSPPVRLPKPKKQTAAGQEEKTTCLVAATFHHHATSVFVASPSTTTRVIFSKLSTASSWFPFSIPPSQRGLRTYFQQ